MHLKELTIAEFDAFAKTCPISSYYQSSKYALFMTEYNYEYDLLGFVDELGIIKAAALILIKKIGLTYKYGYSPKGFLIDYFDYDLLASFTETIKKYYAKKLTFIKINPEIAIGEINKYSKITNYNGNIVIRDYLKELNYIKLKDNIYFESKFPRFNAIINLQEYSFDKISKNTKNKVRKAIKKGLEIEKVDRHGLDILFQFIKRKKSVNEFYYKNYYNVFEKNNKCEIFLIKINYEKYLLNSKELYDKELIINNELANKVINNPNETNINQKMMSDKTLLSYKNDIELATIGLRNNKTTYIAGAMTIKYLNRINIVISGIDTKYRSFNANYFLHYSLIEYYKKDYKFLDLNGLTGDFSNSNPYKGLNDFKLGWNPHIYEFIGEFDLILNEKNYKNLNKKGLLAKEFNQKKKEKN